MLDELLQFLFKNDLLYFCCQPEIIDFTNDYTGNLCFYGKNESMFIPMPNKTELRTFVPLLVGHVFSKRSVVLTWSIKNLFSYFFHRLQRNYDFDYTSKIIDIQCAEKFSAKKEEMPTKFPDAAKRAASSVSLCNKIHEFIHIPLSMKVVPKMETHGLLNQYDKKLSYLCYEIEGQKHGRMNSSIIGNKFINLPSLSHWQKKAISPGQDKKFIIADFKAAEVRVLAALSGDVKLNKIIESGKDIYATIGLLCGSIGRKEVKASFLPYVYGASIELIAELLNISFDNAKMICDLYHSHFSNAFAFVEDAHKKAEKGDFVDYFGRKRHYGEKPHVARNASIQGPAAIIYQEKLIKVSCQELVGTVHDGYYFAVSNKDLREMSIDISEKLESPSELLPNLRLSVDLKVGNVMGNVQEYKF